MDYDVLHLGEEREPLVLVEDMFDVDALVADAEGRAFSANSAFYPGIRAEAPLDILKPHGPALTGMAREVFGAKGLRLIEHNYSLVTQAPEQLAPIQRLPHFDGFEPRLALLVYLRAAGQGGTAFYRQRATGFETVTRERFAEYERALREGVDAEGLGKGYFAGNSHFERIGEVEAVPGRVAIYRGRLIHSGVIPEPSKLSPDPRKGRLSLNTFFLLL